MSTDKKTIGLTSENRSVMNRIFKTDLFTDHLDIAKLAIAVAIRSGIAPSNTDKAETIWNVGSFDPDGMLRKIISFLYPQQTAPYRAAESLINAGLRIIGNNMTDGKQFDLLAVLECSSASSEVGLRKNTD